MARRACCARPAAHRTTSPPRQGSPFGPDCLPGPPAQCAHEANTPAEVPHAGAWRGCSPARCSPPTQCRGPHCRCWPERGTWAAPPTSGRWVSACLPFALQAGRPQAAGSFLCFLPERGGKPSAPACRHAATQPPTLHPSITLSPQRAPPPPPHPPPPGPPGVVLYVMLAGCLPFDEDDLVGLFHKISAASYEVPPWLSDEAAGLLAAMLQPAPEARWAMHR